MGEKMNAGDHIVRNLIANGVETVFGLPGVQTYPLFDALARNADKIRTVSARHEQATAYMALGYAKSTGRPSVYSVVPGPGVLNTGAALCTAYGVNAPIMCLTGQVPSEFLGRERGHLHELADQVNLAARLCDRADDGEILLSPRAHTAIEDSFEAESNGDLSLKGIRDPVEVFKLISL